MIGPEDWQERFGPSSGEQELEATKLMLDECLTALAVVASRVEMLTKQLVEQQAENAKLGADIVDLGDRVDYLVGATHRLQQQRPRREEDGNA